ncbi:MAG: hypothetical protein V3R87_09980 [Dehalococcoidia bacterium]
MGVSGFIILALVLVALAFPMLVVWKRAEAKGKAEACELLTQPVATEREISRALANLRPVTDGEGKELARRLMEKRLALANDAVILVCPGCGRENAVRTVGGRKAKYRCASCKQILPDMQGLPGVSD